MISTRYSTGLSRPAWLAVLILCLTPAVLPAETITFRNECRIPVVVQTFSVVRGALKRDRAVSLRSNEASPKITLDTDKLVIIYDGRVPNRILYRDGVRLSKKPLYLGIVPDVVPIKVKLMPRPAFTPGKGGGTAGPGMTGPKK
jgi:hypothetical protein